MRNDFLAQFNTLSDLGHDAKNRGDHETARGIFDEANILAINHGDKLKQIHALTPAARAEWSLGQLAAALIPFGNRTPLLAKTVRSKFIR